MTWIVVGGRHRRPWQRTARRPTQCRRCTPGTPELIVFLRAIGVTGIYPSVLLVPRVRLRLNVTESEPLVVLNGLMCTVWSMSEEPRPNDCIQLIEHCEPLVLLWDAGREVDRSYCRECPILSTPSYSENLATKEGHPRLFPTFKGQSFLAGDCSVIDLECG